MCLNHTHYTVIYKLQPHPSCNTSVINLPLSNQQTYLPIKLYLPYPSKPRLLININQAGKPHPLYEQGYTS